MRTESTMTTPTDMDMIPLEALCAACGSIGPVAIVATLDDGSSSLALCTICAREREHLRALVRALGSRPLPMVDAPGAEHAA